MYLNKQNRSPKSGHIVKYNSIFVTPPFLGRLRNM